MLKLIIKWTENIKENIISRKTKSAGQKDISVRQLRIRKGLQKKKDGKKKARIDEKKKKYKEMTTYSKRKISFKVQQ